MRYRNSYQATHDIDWFCICHGHPVHVASNGGYVPEQIDSSHNYRMQRAVYEHLSWYDDVPVTVNIDLLRRHIPEIFVEREDEEDLREILREESVYIPRELLEQPVAVQLFCKSFVEIAKLGFCSFYTINDSEDEYKGPNGLICIAYPNNPTAFCREIEFESLPSLDIAKIGLLIY